MVRAELQQRDRKEENLPLLFKEDKSKVARARRLRQETIMSLKWINAKTAHGQLDLRFQRIV